MSAVKEGCRSEEQILRLGVFPMGPRAVRGLGRDQPAIAVEAQSGPDVDTIAGVAFEDPDLLVGQNRAVGMNAKRQGRAPRSVQRAFNNMHRTSTARARRAWRKKRIFCIWRLNRAHSDGRKTA